MIFAKRQNTYRIKRINTEALSIGYKIAMIS